MQRLLYILIAIGTMAGLYAAGLRFRVEQKNRRVELAIDFQDAEKLAEIAGKPLPRVLAQFRRAGIGSAAISEDTLDTLQDRGAIRLQSSVAPPLFEVRSSELLQRIKRHLAARGFPITDDAEDMRSTVFEEAAPVVGEEAPDNERPNGFAVRADWNTIRLLGVGLDPDAIALAQQAKLGVVARIGNFPGVSRTRMEAVIAEAVKTGAKTVVFSGVEVLGYRGQYKDAAIALQSSGLQFGQVEFGKQKGDEALGGILKGEFVRAHSISEGEMAMLSERDAIDRFVKAARERNIRLCYLRPMTTAGEDPIGTNSAYIQAIRNGIVRGGEMGIGPARTYPETGVGAFVFCLIALGAAGGFVLLVTRLFPLGEGRVLALLIFALIGCIGAAAVLGETGQRLVALLAALVFPSLACLRRDLLQHDAQGSTAVDSVGTSAAKAVRGIIAASAVTSIGIVSVVGLLATRPFMMKANQFLGIKAAHAIPLLLIAAAAVAGLPRLDRVWKSERCALKTRLSKLVSEPVLIGALIAGAIGLIVVALILMRTGNEPGVGVSGMELQLRSLLDRVLPIRPRFKEVLLGHPALVLGLALWFRGRRRWALPLFVVGVVGQVSILNTFCHIHTPLRLSLIRDVIGIGLGTAIGLAIFWLVERVISAQPTHVEPIPAAPNGSSG